MKRLNLGQVYADETRMQRVDPFFTLVLFLFCILCSSYFALDYHLSGITVEQQKVQVLERKITELTVANESIRLQSEQALATEKGSSRHIASIQLKKQISFDDLYKSQLHTAVLNKNGEAIMATAQKIMTTSADSELLAEAMFQKSMVYCHLKLKESLCFSEIESLVSQFPESKWAGESLVELSEIYRRLKRFSEAESVIHIVRTEFAHDKTVLSRLTKAEKKKL